MDPNNSKNEAVGVPFHPDRRAFGTMALTMPEGTLNLPGRDQKIEQCKQYLRNLGKAGFYYRPYARMGNGIWSSGRAPVRGASGREFDLSSPKKKGVWGEKSWQEPLSH